MTNRIKAAPIERQAIEDRVDNLNQTLVGLRRQRAEVHTEIARIEGSVDDYEWLLSQEVAVPVEGNGEDVVLPRDSEKSEKE